MGMSLGQLASRVGKTAASVRSWERGEEDLDPDLLAQVAEVLELDLGEFAPAVTTASPLADIAMAAPEPEPPAPEPGLAAPEPEPVPEPVPEPEPELPEPEPEPELPEPEPEPEPELPAPEPEVAAPEPEVAAPGPVAETLPAPEGVTAPDVFDTTEDATGVEGRSVVPPMPERPTHEAEVMEAEVMVVTDPRPLLPATDLLDAPTAAIPVEDMEREAKRVRASAQPLPAGSVVLPHYLDDPRERRLYWMRAGLTAVALFILLVVVLWSAGHLGDAIGEVIDQFGSSVQ
jgi:transcriptional regulator with XRE-family HTH domain